MMITYEIYRKSERCQRKLTAEIWKNFSLPSLQKLSAQRHGSIYSLERVTTAKFLVLGFSAQLCVTAAARIKH